MSLSLTVYSEDVEKLKNWVNQLSSVVDIRVTQASEVKEYGQIVFVDGTLGQLEEFLKKLDRKGRAIFLVLDEHHPFPDLLARGLVDDLITIPFRRLEVMSKVRCYEQILMWKEVEEMHASFSDVLEYLHEELRVAERIQKAKLPKRFPQVKGFKVSSRYIAGMRSGGDYFDLAESSDKKQLSIILSHSTSYGLSSAVLSSVMSVTAKLSLDHLRKKGATTEVVKRIYDELAALLGEKNQLSLFYGSYSREDQCLRYMNFGNISAYYSALGHSTFELPRQGGVISSSSGFKTEKEGEIHLEPESRFALVSDGFTQAFESAAGIRNYLDQFRDNDSLKVLNEFAFKVKSKLGDENDVPARDCTAIIFDVNSRVLRLAKAT